MVENQSKIERFFPVIKPMGSSTLRSGRIVLRRGHIGVTGTAEATIHLSPKPRVVFAATLPPTAESIELTRLEGPLTAEFDRLRPIEVIDVATQYTSDCSCNLRLLPARGKLSSVDADSLAIQRVEFHVLNFPSFLSLGEPSADLWSQGDQGKRLGRLLLDDPEASVEIQELEQTEEVLKQLRETGGSAVTHVGRLKLSVEGDSVRTIDAVLRRVHSFLSFASGHWVGVVAVRGHAHTNELVYEDWNVRLCDQWEGHSNWFDVHNGQWLPALYPGFCRLIGDETFKAGTEAALYWYLRSNLAGSGPGVDGGIILSHAALERLAHDIAAREGLDTGRKPAQVAIRQALEVLGIPATIPPSLGALQAGQREGLWEDIAGAISKVRNNLVHPRRVASKPEAIPEAWKAAQWLIEMMLLRLAGYDESYSNRLRVRWVGETDLLPWRGEPAS